MVELEKYAQENSIPIMQKDGIEFLCNYIQRNNIKRILEIGSAIGYSALKMVTCSDNVSVTTIERDVDRYNLAVENIKKYQMEEKISIILGDALDIELDGEYDLIFIDAAKSQYIKFFEKYKKLLTKNGVIVSDNLDFHGLILEKEENLSRNVRGLVRKLKKYVLFLKENEEFETQFYSIGDGISISKRK